MRQATCFRRLPFVARPYVAAILCLLVVLCLPAGATPAHRIALVRYYGRFLPRRLDACTTCHRNAPGAAGPTSLKEFPHNAFGARLMEVGAALQRAGKPSDLPARLKAVAREDADGDGIDNESELLLGHRPGDASDRPSPTEMAAAAERRSAFARFLAGYRWQPFASVRRPVVPRASALAGSHNPIDAFLAAEWSARGLKPRPEANRATLLRRVSIDLTGLAPTADELRAFLADRAPDSYERAVDRMLASPRYGERWGRHWMDVWRYSDWAGWADGGQVRDSKPHIWRWRDWIVESLNRDKGYDRMAQEMLAADELCPEDTDALRATGFLVRNYKLLSREQWLEDTVGHTSRAFLGITMQCARCHDHMYDPISQKEYYRLRAVFEPHNVRTDRIPGQLDTARDGLVRAYDADLKAATYLYIRGDERNPDRSQPMAAGVPAILGGDYPVVPVKLPANSARPDRRDFVRRDLIADAAGARERAEKALEAAKPELRADLALDLEIARAAEDAARSMCDAERLEDKGQKESPSWRDAAIRTEAAQRRQTLAEARRALSRASAALAAGKKPASDPETTALAMKAEEARAALAKQEARIKEAPSTAYTPRPTADYPAESSGRRLAFARWLTDTRNPLTARVAVNHIWARHFGEGIVPTLADFGRNGRPPSHPQLLDWLAAEFMANGWRMKPLHRLIVTSSAYRMASTPDAENLKRDPDNVCLWRMNSRRMEAEAVRDNLLYLAGSLDETPGGPEVDHAQGLVSRRRSIYLRQAAEKEVPFLKIFDGPSVTECYERRPSVMPQQALALANSALAQEQAKRLAATLSGATGAEPARFVENAFRQILSRPPTAEETRICAGFLAEQTRTLSGRTPPVPDAAAKARANLALVLFNHNDFVTVR